MAPVMDGMPKTCRWWPITVKMHLAWKTLARLRDLVMVCITIERNGNYSPQRKQSVNDFRMGLPSPLPSHDYVHAHFGLFCAVGEPPVCVF
ncbi:hypothetical protein TNCV_3560811 [Trichonephila clavipes]|nr:hypothetical protein TNCV_3560811 [Trichonephila clavipes]